MNQRKRRVIGISFAHGSTEFLKGRERLNSCYAQLGLDKIISFGWDDIVSSPFYRDNRFVLSQSRGRGYWLWKPYLIYKTLLSCSPGDIVWYNDSRNVISGNQRSYIEQVVGECGMYLRHDPVWIRSQYTKRDAFVLMGLDAPKYWNGRDIHAATLAFNRESLPLVEEWLHWCRHPNVITDLPNVCGLPNLDGFVDHRHDQAVLALLANKYDLPLQPADGHSAFAGEYRTQVPL